MRAFATRARTARLLIALALAGVAPAAAAPGGGGRGGGLVNALAFEIMIYDPTGKLVLVCGDGHIDGYRWTMEGGTPMLAGGRSIRLDGSIFETKRRTPAAAP
jgi:hypothetical protein